MNDLTQSETVSLIFYGLIALYLATRIPHLFRGRFMAGVMALGFWIAAFVVVITGYAYRFELNAVADRVMATVIPGTPIQTAPKEVMVMRDRNGAFTIHGVAGNARLSFILDTGASAVVLRAEDAARIGIKVKQLSYNIDVATANGHALTAATTLHSLAIGDVVETDVPVLVAKTGMMPNNLLGMTFLDRLASFTVADNRLILRGR